jgi:hypothetical protein
MSLRLDPGGGGMAWDCPGDVERTINVARYIAGTSCARQAVAAPARPLAKLDGRSTGRTWRVEPMPHFVGTEAREVLWSTCP